MTSDTKIVSCGFKLEEQAKRKFDAAARAVGTTMSEVIRKGVLSFLNEMEEGVEHPQFRIELNNDHGMNGRGA